MLEDALEHLVKGIVDHPEDVEVRQRSGRRGPSLEVRVNPEDMGQVIGRMGQTAKAIRTLLRVVGAKHKARVNLKIFEPEGSHRGPRREMGGQPGGMNMGHQGGAPMSSGISDDSIDEFKL